MAGLPFGWGAIFGIINLLVGGAVVAWIKLRPRMRELSQSAEERFRDDMVARVEKLERLLEKERADHAAETAAQRHRMNNLDQCLTMLLALIEQDPDKAREAAARVRDMRAKQEVAEAAEKGVIAGAKIIAAGPGQAGSTAP